ncbi:MAG: carbon-nitrogen hydrolase family protein [Opitutaceae bacterium]|nr:carbon-nitrogen hydrolase family protein [Opitutaceae bacterium]
MDLVLATCQFPVDRDPAVNRRHIAAQLREARRRGAHLAHFPECALSGYAGVEFPSFAGYPWPVLAEQLRAVRELARRLRIWVVLGSSHRLTGRHRPHNCLYVIDARGRIVDRYDKRFCTGRPGRARGDLRHFTPGDHFVTFRVRGFRCGVLICHDFRYPELYRAYRRLGVDLLLHSFHNGHSTAARYRTKGRILGVIVPATVQAAAASNHCWISATNTTRRISCWPAFVARPDGLVAGRLRRHRASVLVTRLDPVVRYDDASAAWRDRALRGVLHSGRLVRDPRSRARRRA